MVMVSGILILGVYVIFGQSMSQSMSAVILPRVTSIGSGSVA